MAIRRGRRSYIPLSFVSDDWLISRRADVLFLIAVLLVLMLTLVLLSSVDPSQMSLAIRLPLTVFAMAGTGSLFLIWFGMLQYWMRIDQSTPLAKRLWFVILLFGLWYGACLYYFFVYRRQVKLVGRQD